MRTSLITLVVLLVAFGAQGQSGPGYSYTKPDKQFAGAGAEGGQQGYPSSGPSGQAPGYPSARPGGQQGPTSSGGAEGGQQGYPSASVQRPGGVPDTGYPSSGPSGQAPGYPGGQQGAQGPTSSGAQDYPAGRPGFQPQTPQGYPSGPQGQPGYPSGGSAQQGPTPQAYPSAGPGQQQGYPSGPGGQGPSGPSFGSEGGQAPSGPSFQQGPVDDGDYSAIPGEPDVDYPILSDIPTTAFRCDDQQYPGYYADVETRCQVFHVCANNKTYDFLCPNGTIFHQEYLVCVWWNQFDCGAAPSLFGVNANIYDYSLVGALQSGQFSGQAPTGQYPSGPSTSFPTAGYPGGQGPTSPAQGPSGPSVGPAATRAPQAPGQFGGYPSDVPQQQRPGQGPQQPTREYLPPVNG